MWRFTHRWRLFIHTWRLNVLYTYYIRLLKSPKTLKQVKHDKLIKLSIFQVIELKETKLFRSFSFIFKDTDFYIKDMWFFNSAKKVFKKKNYWRDYLLFVS